MTDLEFLEAHARHFDATGELSLPSTPPAKNEDPHRVPPVCSGLGEGTTAPTSQFCSSAPTRSEGASAFSAGGLAMPSPVSMHKTSGSTGTEVQSSVVPLEKLNSDITGQGVCSLRPFYMAAHITAPAGYWFTVCRGRVRTFYPELVFTHLWARRA